jgi:DHA3 family macrolide efflux protein-like MFS transporter
MPLILVATFSFAVFSIGLGFSPNLIVFYAFMLLFGLFVPLFFVSIVMALAAPVGIAVFGPLADVISVRVLLVVGGLVMAAVIVIAIIVPSGRAAIATARKSDPGMVPDAAPDPDSGG